MARRPASPRRTSPAAPPGRTRRRAPASPGRRLRRSGRTAGPASGPACAAVRCLICSILAAPSAKQMLVADSSATSANRCPPPSASPATAAADRTWWHLPGWRMRAAASRPHTGTRTPLGDPRPRRQPPGPGPPAPAARPAPRPRRRPRQRRMRHQVPARPPAPAPARAAAPVLAGGREAPAGAGNRQARRTAPAAGCAGRGPRRRPTVVSATPSRRPISVSDSPCPRQAAALAQSGSPSLEGRPGRARRISAADPSRSAARCKVAT